MVNVREQAKFVAQVLFTHKSNYKIWYNQIDPEQYAHANLNGSKAAPDLEWMTEIGMRQLKRVEARINFGN